MSERERALRKRAEAAEADYAVLDKYALALNDELLAAEKRDEAAQAELQRLRDQLDEAVRLLREVATLKWRNDLPPWHERVDAFLAARSTPPTAEKED